MSREKIQMLCDIHLKVFKEAIEKQNETNVEEPISVLMKEHNILLDYADKLKKVANYIIEKNDYNEFLEKMDELKNILEHFKDSEKHYLREENALFPVIEKHGIVGPPQIMWSEHNEIRKIKKELYKLVEDFGDISFKEFSSKLNKVSNKIYEYLQSHFYKENNILFPTALKVISKDEWASIKNDFNEIGYCCFAPGLKKEEKKEEKSGYKSEKISLETGSFTEEELITILNTLPVDITFVDKDDTVRYFSQSKDRIFIRTKSVLGRKVQLCHPQQSIHKVQEIVNDFKNNKRDVAEFWINLKGIYEKTFNIYNYIC